ncbi:MAG TPA: SusF/SusE family outer membrane protein, partial [Saprospiraceae bacterium]|nr:SusF/SusE family outer membrane protein [Saprospiraceae bacterium]
VGIIGSATPTGWGSDTEMKNDGNGNFSILIGLDNGEVKFRANKDWAINWGAAAFPSGIGTQGGANIPVTKGIYLVTFNANTGAYNFAPASIGIIGSATPSGWGSDTNMNEDAAVGVVKVSIALSADEVKFRANDDWAINWGGSGFPTGVGTQGGPNIKIPAAGTYNVSFNVNTGEYSFTQ